MNGELLDILVELALCSWESVQDNSLRWLGFLDFLIDDFDNNFVADKSSCFDDSSDGFDEIFVESAAYSAFEDLPDLISSR